MEKYDVVIAGGGPGGCSAALNLHRLDPDLARRTLVLEKARHPREKVCGGGLTLKVDLLLSLMGLQLTVPYTQLNVQRIRYHGRNYDYLLHGWVKVIRRDEFDASLARALAERGIALHEEEEVTDVKWERDGIAVSTSRGSYLAKVVVAADGVHSVVRRKMGFPAGKPLIQDLVVELPCDVKREPVWLYKMMLNDWDCYDLGSYGYYWEFPVLVRGKQHLQCGLYSVSREESKNVKPVDVFREMLKRRGIKLDDHKLLGFPERGFDPEAEFSQPNVLLIGEAAGIDVLTGEGISQAMEYGVLAAETVVDAFRSGDLSFKGYKEALLKSRLGRELARNLKVAEIAFDANYDATVPLRLAAFKKADSLERLRI
ncbi:MAG: NAD(P)/FAD-dependent oxidoreductase [Chloroflexota bacterium]